MDKADLDRLWELPWFHWNLRAYYQLDRRRHLRWDRHMRTIYYVVRRSAPRMSQTAIAEVSPGRFAIDKQTLHWLWLIEDTGRVEHVYVVLVEDWTAPPQIVNHINAVWLWDRLETVEPFAGIDNNRFWWLNDEYEPQDAWLGPVLEKPPF